MNKIPNRQAICEVLMDRAKDDKDIVVYSKIIGKGSEITNMTHDTYVILSAKRLL